MANLGALASSSSIASAAAGASLVPCWKRSGVFQPARPQQQQARQQNGQNCASVRCQSAAESSSEDTSISRRAAIGGSLALAAAAANLQAALPAAARQVVSSDWEKVDLPVDPGVVLLDIGFTDDKHGFLLGTRETLLETKDGGRTWKQRSIEAAKDEGFNYRFNSISFNGQEGWICGKPAILLHTTDAGENWERVPLSAKLPGNPILVVALPGEGGRAEMTTDQGAVYVTKNAAYSWQAAVQESVDATLNRTVSSGISGASYYEGSFSNIQRSPAGDYVAVSSRGNFFLTWSPGQTYWQPHNRPTARRVQNMGWTPSNSLWLSTRGGDVYLSTESGVSDKFDQAKLGSRGFGILDVGFKANSKEGYAVGGSGTLLKTEDLGQSWKRDRSTDGVAGNLYAVKFTPGGAGFILGNDGILLRYIA
ncbi:hypothetical protein CVIRNUC_000060 [Coccomyxa viridis]|uniref:Photosynthesis system II assembly factor Ycf48/Hcf136-like domain-containing protein n=1 Tax=Coccomyxa viridis TaxID=1274662 RepID=A0AAV1HT02_9CHLO|nr:hypothetical protein CVIRNUC_000060 [Coccomyxa viridis]